MYILNLNLVTDVVVNSIACNASVCKVPRCCCITLDIFHVPMHRDGYGFCFLKLTWSDIMQKHRKGMW